MTTVNKYRMYCNTESAEKFCWSETEPTYCPTNTAHSVDSSKTRIVQTLEEKTFTVDEGKNSLGGYYRIQGEKIVMPTNHVILGQTTGSISIGGKVIDVEQTVINTISLDNWIGLNDGTTSGLIGKVICIDNTNNQLTVGGSTGSGYLFESANVENYTTVGTFAQKKDIGVLSMHYVSSESNNGDGLEFQVYPIEVVGALTANLSTGGTILNVSQTVVDNIKVGFLCRLTNGAITECMGEVLNVDTVNNQITIEKPSLNNFLASSPTYVMLTVRTGITPDIGNPGMRNPGIDKIGASFIAKNKSVRVCYNNFTGGAKKFVFSVGHMY